MVLEGPAAPPIADLHRHGPGDNISGGEVLGSRGIALHEAFSFAVEEVGSFTTATFCDEAASTIYTCKNPHPE